MARDNLRRDHGADLNDPGFVGPARTATGFVVAGR